jgi:hypothetical protein
MRTRKPVVVDRLDDRYPVLGRDIIHSRPELGECIVHVNHVGSLLCEAARELTVPCTTPDEGAARSANRNASIRADLSVRRSQLLHGVPACTKQVGLLIDDGVLAARIHVAGMELQYPHAAPGRKGRTIGRRRTGIPRRRVRRILGRLWCHRNDWHLARQQRCSTSVARRDATQLHRRLVRPLPAPPPNSSALPRHGVPKV